MIKIYKPELKRSSTGVRAQAIYEYNGSKNVLWYEVEEKYSDYLTIERADAFLVGLLFYAIKKGEDIEVHAPLSERLFYTINKYLAELIAEVHGYKKIRVYCEELTSDLVRNEGAVGMGLSCGIDSFATLIDHLEDDCPKNYEVTHFTFFNVGSNGDVGGEGARALFAERAKNARAYSEEFGYKFITVDSNISEILNSIYASTHTIRSMSAVLVLQKLFKCYYYASAYPIKDFKLRKNSMGSYDIFNLSMLSTESLSLFSSCANKTRVEKTKMVGNFRPAYKYLNVCVNDNNNCGRCPKCLRTLLTLELFGKLKEFESVFNLEAYEANRNMYINQVIAEHQSNVYSREIFEEMKRQNFKFPSSSK
ncbi:hypothetical protein [Pontibacillus marinus]|uniref:Uncharacterized protein n=1 Tax=Pontibacillus marinus BH030004 = DSM 16465 TaxID=1385511 RepID=A0A0A5I2I4_9BACI|nr:hypothetical protein [Pontibacillus marinus]KGX90047.1 hypothetical protein N783_02365 [Pontibacillus marinus BH030004 = DSM 16465]